MTLPLSDALPVLVPYFPRFYSCVSGAVDDYRANRTPLDKARDRKRTRSSIINDSMVHNARTAFVEDPDVTLYEEYGYTRLLIEDFSIRMKKLDHNFRTHNVPTQEALAFVYQMSFQMRGLRALTNLALGYQWNDLETEITGVYLVCPRGTQNEWVIAIPRPDSGPDLQQLPVRPPQPQGPDTDRVFPKKDTDTDTGTDGANV